jgi:fucose permease
MLASASDAGIGRAATRLPLVVQAGTFVLILGVTDGALGVLWPSMRATFHLPLDDLGVLSVAGTALYFTGGLLANRIRGRLGVGNVLAASCVLALVALVTWGTAADWPTVLVAVALLGFAKGVVDAAVNAEAAMAGGMRRLGLLHGSWAIGGMFGPLLVAAVLAWAHDWRAAVVVMAVGALALTPLSVLARRPATPLSAPEPVDEQAPAPPVPAPPVPVRRFVLLATVTVFVVYAAAENGPIAWGYSYLILDRHVSRTLAALALAMFWAGLTAGRFALAVASDRFAAALVLELSCLLVMVGSGLLWLLPGTLAVIGLPIAGLGAAAVFPVLVALMPRRVGQARTGQAVGVSIAAACFGGPVAVALFGLLAAHLGVGVLGACIFGAAVLLYVGNRGLSFATGRWAA